MKSLKWLLALCCAEGFVTVLWIFFTPSEGKSAIVLWLSRERILLSGFALVLWGMLLVAGITAWRSPIILELVHAKIDRFCLEDQRLGSLLLFLLVIPLLVLASTLKVALTPLEYDAYRSWAPDTFPLLHSLVGALLPFLALISLIGIELAVFLAIRYQPTRESTFWQA